MVDEARTTAGSTRTSVQRLRVLALAGMGFMAAAATVAAGSPTPTSSASASTASPMKVSIAITSPTGGKVRQGQTVKYQVDVQPGNNSYTHVIITLAASPDWAQQKLQVNCPSGATTNGTSCDFGDSSVSKDVEFTASLIVPTDTPAGSAIKATVAAQSNEAGKQDPSSPATIDVVAKQSHSPTPTSSTSSSPTSKPTPSKPGTPTSSATPTGSGGKHPGSGGGPGSGSGGNGGSGGGSHPGSGGTVPGSGGTGTGSGSGQPHPTLAPGGTLSGVPPSLGAGSSLSATSLPGISTSPAPTPLVAIPPSTGTSGSPSDSIQLTGESRGTVQPVTRGIPLAAVGLVLFVVSGWRLLRRRVRKVNR